MGDYLISLLSDSDRIKIITAINDTTQLQGLQKEISWGIFKQRLAEYLQDELGIVLTGRLNDLTTRLLYILSQSPTTLQKGTTATINLGSSTKLRGYTFDLDIEDPDSNTIVSYTLKFKLSPTGNSTKLLTNYFEDHLYIRDDSFTIYQNGGNTYLDIRAYGAGGSALSLAYSNLAVSLTN